MAIRVVIRGARVQEGYGGQWWVMHPSNGGILAYCDTEREAAQLVAEIGRMADRAERHANAR